MTDDLDGPDDLDADLGDTYDASTHPEPHEAARALATLTAARRILRDAELMAAVRQLLAEQRRAVNAAGKE